MSNSAQDKLEEFSKNFPLRSYKKGEIVIRADDNNPPGVFYLVKGYVRKYKITVKGEEFTQNILQPKTTFRLSWILSDSPNQYFFEAITSVEVKFIPVKDMQNFLDTNTDVLLFLMQQRLHDYEQTLTRIEELMLSDAYKRVIMVLLYIMNSFPVRGRRRIHIPQRFTYKDIANFAGITRETASLEMGKLEKKEIISYLHHAITIENIKKLQKELL